MKKFIQFKIDSKVSKIPKLIKTPKSKYETPSGNFKNFINQDKINFAKALFLLSFDYEKKILKCEDNHNSSIHGIYNIYDLKKIKQEENGCYYFSTNREVGFPLGHIMNIRHVCVFDPDKKKSRLTNQVFYYFKKHNEKSFKLFDDKTIVVLKSVKFFDSAFDAISPKLKKKFLGKKVLNKSIKILKSKPKIKRTMWSRRAQEYEKVLGSEEAYDIIKLAKIINNLMYDYNVDKTSSFFSVSMFLKSFIKQYFIWYAINKNKKSDSLHEVFEILNLDIKNKDKNLTDF